MEVSRELIVPWTTWVVITASTTYILYKYFTRSFGYFSEQRIPGPKPLPIFGNTWGIWKQNMPKVDQELVKTYGKTFGTFDGSQPNLWTIDTEIIKSVFVKDFDHFINRRALNFDVKVLRRFLPFMRDQEWKDVRSSITPVFTSGKIKRMSVMIKERSDKLVSSFEEIARKDGQIHAKAQFSAFTMDVIARCVFGLTLEDLSIDDPFLMNAKKALKPPVNKSPLVLVILLLPQMITMLQRYFRVKELDYFIEVVEKMIKDREATQQKFHDFVEAATESISEFTKEVNGQNVPIWNKEEVDEIITAVSLIFLFAGFDTTATTLTLTIYQLAKEPAIQEKLYDEIQNRLEQIGDVNHEMIQKLPYLDQVINEVMRFYPVFPRVERECSKDITVKGIHIKKDMIVTVPTFALHFDPDYYPDPHTFNPDRWSPENKPKLNSYAYMPFGMGPRNCVGMRFALEEIKIALCCLVQHFRFFAVKETPDKIEYEDGLLQIAQCTETTVGIELRS